MLKETFYLQNQAPHPAIFAGYSWWTSLQKDNEQIMPHFNHTTKIYLHKSTEN